MSLHHTILNDLTEAMKARETERVEVLRMIKAALLNTAKESGADSLSDEEVILVLGKEAKKRKESEQAFTDGNRPELAQKEAAERAIIDAYLPEQMSEEEVRAKAQAVIDGLDSPNFGAAMGAVMQELKGQADGALVKQVVQELMN